MTAEHVPSNLSAASETPRIAEFAARFPEREALVRHLVDLSTRGLPQMFRDDAHIFAHTLRRANSGGSVHLEGTSLRYGAIVLLGAQFLAEDVQRELFAGENAREFSARCVDEALRTRDLGNASLVAWAAHELGEARAAQVLEHARRLGEQQSAPFTVELAWLLSASCAAGDRVGGQLVRDRLLTAYSARSGIFPRWVGTPPSRTRGHVGCFADQVYPIQALSRFHRLAGDPAALAAATRCAQQICDLQGEMGQWWWHYDARTGDVVEGYPVYSVHQDSMAPMCLLDLHEAGGPDNAIAIARGLDWMTSANEVGRSLVDDEQIVIWRKVGRREPHKLVRGMRAVTTSIHPGLRVGILDGLFPANAIEFESRPYHLGWVLHTWLGRL